MTCCFALAVELSKRGGPPGITIQFRLIVNRNPSTIVGNYLRCRCILSIIDEELCARSFYDSLAPSSWHIESTFMRLSWHWETTFPSTIYEKCSICDLHNLRYMFYIYEQRELWKQVTLLANLAEFLDCRRNLN